MLLWRLRLRHRFRRTAVKPSRRLRLPDERKRWSTTRGADDDMAAKLVAWLREEGYTKDDGAIDVEVSFIVVGSITSSLIEQVLEALPDFP